ncbi:MAG: hypothetical protein PHC51_13925 [bacterium]|nr:hypothetical protein [bacterium]
MIARPEYRNLLLFPLLLLAFFLFQSTVLASLFPSWLALPDLPLVMLLLLAVSGPAIWGIAGTFLLGLLVEDYASYWPGTAAIAFLAAYWAAIKLARDVNITSMRRVFFLALVVSFIKQLVIFLLQAFVRRGGESILLPGDDLLALVRFIAGESVMTAVFAALLFEPLRRILAGRRKRFSVGKPGGSSWRNAMNCLSIDAIPH